MKTGLLIDRMRVTQWQAEAIRQLGNDVELVVYNCTNSPTSRRRLRHYPYYLLNLLSLRSDLTRQVELPRANVAETVDFESEIRGAWQSLPATLVDRINADRPWAIVKFGLGLLKVPNDLAPPILSYHHGDPRRFRGRPAGFWELLTGAPVLGQIVQILSNRLDAGEVVAYAETPVQRHSYRATMRKAYSVSPLLLPKALQAVMAGRRLPVEPGKSVYRLPSATTVLRFAARRMAEKARRLAYGAFFEKRWRVARTGLAFSTPPFLENFPPKSKWSMVDCPPGYRFLADPFPSPSGGMLVEALRSSTGRGEILEIDANGSRTFLRGRGHFSYPATIATDDGDLLVPEVCEWSIPKMFRLESGKALELGSLDMIKPVRLVDPTLFERDGTVFLFGNDYAEGDFILRLWCSDSIEGKFAEHPQSPVLISPRGGRMGGLLVKQDKLYRIGQDGSGQYGDGIFVFRLDALDRNSYRETLVDELRFTEVRGPHTLNFTEGSALFDFYTDGFAPLAGLRRLKYKLAARP